MKQTRKIIISEKVFTEEDLQRIGRVFEKQMLLSKESGDNTTIKYEVKFSDNTTIESDSLDIFTDESLSASARPVEIRMSFFNHIRSRHLFFSVGQGDSIWGNSAEISGSELDWLGETFLAIKESLDCVKPQEFWLRRHQVLLVNLIALGIGTLGMLFAELLATLLHSVPELSELIKPLPPDSPWRHVFQSSRLMFYIFGWVWRWAAGFAWGAFGVRRWLLKMWPSIEFEFGLLHLRTEQIQRKRLLTVIALIVLPILMSLLYDLAKGAL